MADIAALCLGSLCLLFFGVAGATAAPRFAAPGSNGPQPCAQSNPCALFAAAAAGQGAKQGDEVVVEPGRYLASAGDFGPTNAFTMEAGVTLHGVFGAPRPLLVFDRAPTGASETSGLRLRGDRVARLELESEVDRSDISLLRAPLGPDVVEDVIARSSTPAAVVCDVEDGVLRTSVCLASGASAIAVGDSNPTAEQSGSVALRNVTATSTGDGSIGLGYKLTTAQASPAPTASVSGVGVIAKGVLADVMASGLAANANLTNGAKVKVVLANSDFATVSRETSGGGTAEVTEPGSPTNVIAPPLLAADGYHELPASPTVGTGAVDEFSSEVDIDAEPRAMGNEADIGADELTGTSVALACSPPEILAGGSANCKATVFSEGIGTPTGQVHFLSPQGGSFSNGGNCTVTTVGAGQAGCSVVFTPSGVGPQQITVGYRSDVAFEPALSTTLIQVLGKPRLRLGKPPNTKLRKKPPKTTGNPVARFTFGADQPARFLCKLDKGRFKLCRSPFKIRVKPGRHRFQVQAINQLGGIDPTPASFAWVVRSAFRGKHLPAAGVKSPVVV